MNGKAVSDANSIEGTKERPCVCGHDIWEHEDYDFDIHECNHDGCGCKQFLDAADGAVIENTTHE